MKKGEIAKERIGKKFREITIKIDRMHKEKQIDFNQTLCLCKGKSGSFIAAGDKEIIDILESPDPSPSHVSPSEVKMDFLKNDEETPKNSLILQYSPMMKMELFREIREVAPQDDPEDKILHLSHREIREKHNLNSDARKASH